MTGHLEAHAKCTKTMSIGIQFPQGHGFAATYVVTYDAINVINKGRGRILKESE